MCYQAPYLDNIFHGEELDASTASARLIIPMRTETKISMILIAQTLPGCNPQISSLRGRRKWASLVGVFVKKERRGGGGAEKGQEGRLFLGQRARCGHLMSEIYLALKKILVRLTTCAFACGHVYMFIMSDRLSYLGVHVYVGM